MNVKKQIELLGLKVEDRVTGFSGVVASVSFDLYGCIQAIVNPAVDKDGAPREQRWFDVNRLRVIDAIPVMERPDFDFSGPADSAKGPAEKPAFLKP